MLLLRLSRLRRLCVAWERWEEFYREPVSTTFVI